MLFIREGWRSYEGYSSMTFKDFIRPSLAKVLLWLALCIVYAIAVIAVFFPVSQCAWGMSSSESCRSASVALAILVWPVFLLRPFGSLFMIGIFGWIVPLMVMLAYVYVITCLIVWVFDRFRKRRER